MECLQILKYYVGQELKPIEPPTERPYPIDFIVEFCQQYTNLCDKEDEDVIKQIKAFLPRYDKEQYLKQCAKEYNLKFNSQ